VTIALAAAGTIVVLLVVAQLVLPSMAENQVADDLEKIGPRPDVSVSAFPAVKLLWGKADKVKVDMSTARTPGSSQLADQLERTKDVDELDVRVGTLRAGPLTVRDARLRKDGGDLTATATVRDADLRSALPAFLDNVRPAARQDGRGLLLEGSVAVPIIGTIRAQARVRPVDGAIVARAENIPLLDQIAALTIFSDPRVRVTSVSARDRPGGFDLTAAGTVSG
jgi:hypothetical protein